MKTLLPLLLSLVVLSGGCFDGRQKGKFAVSGSGGRALANLPGSLVILRGHALTNDHQPTGDVVSLLHVLVVCPGLRSNGSGSQASEGPTRSTHKLRWFATPENVTIEFTWDRVMDTVEINGQVYNRTDGNIFVVIRQPDGTVSSTQVESVDGNANEEEVLRHIREELADDQLIANVKLVELESE